MITRKARDLVDSHAGDAARSRHRHQQFRDAVRSRASSASRTSMATDPEEKPNGEFTGGVGAARVSRGQGTSVEAWLAELGHGGRVSRKAGSTAIR